MGRRLVLMLAAASAAFASVAAAATTILAFFFVIFSAAPILKDIGLTVSIGVTLSLLSAMAVCPAASRSA